MSQQLIERTQAYFKEKFNHTADCIFLSPGRINIIGEHIDYNDGFVLPAAINKYICFAVSQNNSSVFNLVAMDLQDEYSFYASQPIQPIDKTWANYILGVIHQIKEKGHQLTGLDIVFSSTIPMGAGLSSSAALECGVGYALNHLFQLGMSKEEIALIGQQSEHQFVGVNCGIMDQFASVFGAKNKVIKLDCNTLEYEYYNANLSQHALVLLDSRVKHTHLTSGYNTRRQEVEKGMSIIKSIFPQVNTFRDCTLEMIQSIQSQLGDTIFNRCLFVVKEIQRVKDAAMALQHNQLDQLGSLMFETHEGLSREYEVSCPELDMLVATAKNTEGIIGSRMMGGGFGGCTINLVKKGFEKNIIQTISKEYQHTFGIELFPYEVEISDGTMLYQPNNQ